MTYAPGVNVSLQHLAMETFKAAAGSSILPPYKGSAQRARMRRASLLRLQAHTVLPHVHSGSSARSLGRRATLGIYPDLPHLQ